MKTLERRLVDVQTKYDEIERTYAHVTKEMTRAERFKSHCEKQRELKGRELLEAHLELEELRLLKDIRDGKVSVVDAKTGAPKSVKFFLQDNEGVYAYD